MMDGESGEKDDDELTRAKKGIRQAVIKKRITK